MANHGCINGSLDGVNYSSPVPVIGLYIAAASSLCLLLMLYDIIVAGFLARKRWLPCEWFTLNSVTLTLLSVAAKLPVDLTTSMPTPKDQLSKLSGTVIICISMGFLLPSLGVNSDSESFTNMVALTIFVVTVAVNICLQLHTGVIVLFFVEHIIILCLMLLLLLFLWHASRHIKSHKRITGDQYRNLITKGKPVMFDRLKLSYLYSYCSNPQYQISMQPVNAAVTTVCLICSIVLIQATFRSVILNQLEFCQGPSDYGWSMPLIVVSQILTVVVGTLAVMFRWIALFSLMELETLLVSFQDEDDHVIQRNQTLRKGWLALHRLQRSVSSLSLKIILIAQLLLVSPAGLVRYFLQLLRVYEQEKLEGFNDLHPGDVLGVTGYIARKSVDDIVRLRSQVSNGESLNHLLQLFSDIYPSQQLNNGQKQVKLPSIAILVKIAEVSIPKELLEPLLHAYRETNEIIHFIDETLQPKSSKNDDELSYAKAVWKGGDLTCLLPKDVTRMQPGLERASKTITCLKSILNSGDIWIPVGHIVDLINPSIHSSTEDLCKSIKQLFVDMLHVSFGELPVAIYKSLTESPAEEFEERARLAMKFTLKIGKLEHIHWSCPPDIQSFVTNDEARGDGPRAFTGRLRGLENVVPISLDPGFVDRGPRGRPSRCWDF